MAPLQQAVILATLTYSAIGILQKRPQQQVVDEDTAVGFSDTDWFQLRSELTYNETDLSQVDGEGVRRYQNMCIKSRLAPQFFLLGVQKSATTTFAAMFHGSPDVIQTAKEAKEFHFFDTKEQFDEKGGYDAYLKLFGECDQTTKKVAVDSTPNYLPSEFAPTAISTLYGENARNIEFAIILREPIDRAYSAYHHGRDDKWGDGRYAEHPFQYFVDNMLTPHGRYLGIWSMSFYAEQLSRWFSVFSPKQFTISGMLHTIAPEAVGVKDPFYKYMLRKLGMRVSQFTGSIPHANSRKHAPLNSSISEESYVKLKSFLYGKASPQLIASILHGSGADLYGCEECNSVDSIATWVETSWG